MAKAIALTPAALNVPQITPQAATPARSPAPAAKATAAVAAPDKKVDHIPLQVRLPRDDVRAIKVAAAQQGMKLNEFMLACFHAYMKA